ncbi:hypothetical protein KC845_01590 [Candidatus Kaiserbacteria bacterium]|nr:hypothetical protein [Candidatus Kaiserbacteria bacterium]
MLDRTHVEKMLRLNGVSPTAPDEEIKSVLISASWHLDDVKTAIMVLRENTESKESRVDTFNKVFRKDEHLKPEMVSSLLGIEMNIDPESVETRRKNKGVLNIYEVVRLVVFSVVLSMLAILFAMWYFQVGFFHFTSV